MTEAPTSLHPDDGDIIRLMDDAVPAAERAIMETHLASCASCRTRKATLGRRTEKLAGLLRATDAPAPATALRPVVRRRKDHSTVGWRVAATVLLVVGAATAVTPVRAWFAGIAKTVWARFGESKVKVEIPDGAVSFVPASSQLTIRVPSQAGGTLSVEVVPGDRVTAQGGSAGVLVLPEEVRFSADPQSPEQYVVRAPLRAEAIHVVVGQAAARILKPKAVGDRWNIPLGSQ